MTKSGHQSDINEFSEWTTFPTSFGICGVAWTHAGITAFCLPEASKRQMQMQLKKITGNSKSSTALPSWIKQLIQKVKAHINSNLQDFSDIPANLKGCTDFQLSVYYTAQKIPAGKVTTYKELAKAIGKPKAARAVGNALGKNPIPLIIPCHRIIASSGKLGGFLAYGGLRMKKALLASEGVYLPNFQ